MNRPKLCGKAAAQAISGRQRDALHPKGIHFRAPAHGGDELCRGQGDEVVLQGFRYGEPTLREGFLVQLRSDTEKPVLQALTNELFPRKDEIPQPDVLHPDTGNGVAGRYQRIIRIPRRHCSAPPRWSCIRRAPPKETDRTTLPYVR